MTRLQCDRTHMKELQIVEKLVSLVRLSARSLSCFAAGVGGSDAHARALTLPSHDGSRTTSRHAERAIEA
jgi:hypothetical protein